MAVMVTSLLRPNLLFPPFRCAQPPHATTTCTSSSTPTALRAPKPTAPAAASSLPKKKVLVPVALGTEEMEAVILVDVLRRSGADVLMASVEKELEVEGSSGTRLVADTGIALCASEVFDLVAIPGGMPGSARLRDCEVLKSITRKQAEEKRLYGAICAAPAIVLESWGLMRRKQMTCHPAFMHKLPTFRASKSNIQVSGELTTSRGPGTAFEFALSFVRQLFGDAHADEVERKLLMQCHGDHRREEFNCIDWSFNCIPRVLVPIANGSEEMEVVTIVDILRRAKVDIVVASVEKSIQIVASQSTKIVADVMIDSIVDSVFDMIILPGGVTGSARLQKSRILKKLLKEQKSSGRLYGAVCSSPAIMQKHGLLTNKRVAAHPSVIGKLNGQVVDGASFIIDGELITGRGSRHKFPNMVVSVIIQVSWQIPKLLVTYKWDKSDEPCERCCTWLPVLSHADLEMLVWIRQDNGPHRVGRLGVKDLFFRLRSVLLFEKSCVLLLLRHGYYSYVMGGLLVLMPRCTHLWIHVFVAQVNSVF